MLGASSYCCAEATWTQGLPDWLGSHVRVLEWLGGCPAILVPDNLRSGMSRPHRYEPDINPAYHALADHYDPAGVGKSYLACALAQQACRLGYCARYLRLPRLLKELAVERVNGRYGKVLASLVKVDALVIDDWAITLLTADGRLDLLEVLDDRHQRRSTLFTSQLAVEQ